MVKVNCQIAGCGDLHNPSFKPITRDRSVKIFVRKGFNWTESRINEPQHDANKLYASIRGLPVGGAEVLDLEDFGLCEHDILLDEEQRGVGAAAGHGVEHTELAFGSLCGGSWVTDIDEPLDEARIAFALHLPELSKWQMVVLTCEALKQQHRKFDAASAIALLTSKATDVDLSRVSVIVPILEPKRVHTNRGVVFCS